ncbi:MAG: hypothetical protein QME64_05405, partial [bacterium]|nr:hypothetical protein [bacterium]
MSKKKKQIEQSIKTDNIKIIKDHKKPGLFNRLDIWLILVLLGITIILFSGIFSFDKTIVSSDFGVWSAKYFASQIRQFTWQKWLPYNHAGGDFSGQPIYPTHLLLFFMPPA